MRSSLYTSEVSIPTRVIGPNEVYAYVFICQTLEFDLCNDKGHGGWSVLQESSHAAYLAN